MQCKRCNHSLPRPSPPQISIPFQMDPESWQHAQLLTLAAATTAASFTCHCQEAAAVPSEPQFPSEKLPHPFPSLWQCGARLHSLPQVRSCLLMEVRTSCGWGGEGGGVPLISLLHCSQMQMMLQWQESVGVQGSAGSRLRSGDVWEARDDL